MPRGGKRPGAGAPPGNLNAWKYGYFSRLSAELQAIRLSTRELRAIIKRRRHVATNIILAAQVFQALIRGDELKGSIELPNHLILWTAQLGNALVVTCEVQPLEFPSSVVVVGGQNCRATEALGARSELR